MKDRKTAGRMVSKMAKQSLRASRMRNMFVMVTIVLASALLTAILLFAAGQKQLETEGLSHMQQVGYYNLTREQAETLKQDDRLAHWIEVKSGILSKMEAFDVMPFYVNELSDRIRVGELEEGTLPEGSTEIAVQAPMLQKMGLEPKTGSTVTLSFYDGSTETFTVSGILKGGESAKQYSIFFSQSYGETGSQLKEMPYEIYATVSGAGELSAGECRELMYAIGRDAGIERKNVGPSKAFLDSLSLDAQSVMLYGLVGAVILLACILVIYGVFYLSVVGRIRQFGQLRTVGMTRKQMKKFVSLEGRSLFLRGAPVGIIIGGVAGYLLLPGGFQVKNALWTAVLVFAVIFAITWVSVHKPARLAAAVSPMEALRYQPSDGVKKPESKKLCRRLTPLDLGMMNFSRNRKKAAVTMLSLALGGILFLTAATYMASFDKENYARQGYFTDAEFYICFPPSALELEQNGLSGLQAKNILNEEMVQEIAALEGVKQVTEEKSFGVRFDYPKNEEYGTNDKVNPITQEELEGIQSYLEEGSADGEALRSGDYILAAGNDIAEEIYGWKFEVGDKIRFQYYDGTQAREKEVTILGTLNSRYVLDHKGLDGWFLMPEQALLDLVSHKNLNIGLLVSTEKEKEASVGEALAELVAQNPELSMETLAERRIAYAQNVSQMFFAISGLSIFIMMFSILSMMNTLITNIVTRKRELAMLESIGMSKSQVRGMLLGESMLLVGVTVAVTMTAGTLCGFMLCRLLYNVGAFYMAFRFPAVFALIYTAILIVVPLLITFVSIRSFSKEALVERLRGAEC